MHGLVPLSHSFLCSRPLSSKFLGTPAWSVRCVHRKESGLRVCESAAQKLSWHQPIWRHWRLSAPSTGQPTRWLFPWEGGRHPDCMALLAKWRVSPPIFPPPFCEGNSYICQSFQQRLSPRFFFCHFYLFCLLLSPSFPASLKLPPSFSVKSHGAGAGWEGWVAQPPGNSDGVASVF